jgi:hypothetical protein
MENIDLGLEIKPREKNQNGLRSGFDYYHQNNHE